MSEMSLPELKPNQFVALFDERTIAALAAQAGVEIGDKLVEACSFCFGVGLQRLLINTSGPSAWTSSDVAKVVSKAAKADAFFAAIETPSVFNEGIRTRNLGTMLCPVAGSLTVNDAWPCVEHQFSRDSSVAPVRALSTPTHNADSNGTKLLHLVRQ
jgi:hypothetical protein